MKLLLPTTLILFLFATVISSCKKENSWSTEIFTIELDSTEAVITADYLMNRNDNYLYVGVCWSASPNPTINSPSSEMQKLHSGTSNFYLEDLEYETKYFIRSFIKTKKNRVIYSEERAFTTLNTPQAPCETDQGKISFNGLNYTMDDLDPYTGDYYELKTSCGFGDLNFTFKNKPSKNKRYTTVISASDLTSNSVHVSGVLGGGWLTCYHGAGDGQYVYVELNESGEISIKLCSLIMYPSGSCEDNKILIGEVHQ